MSGEKKEVVVENGLVVSLLKYFFVFHVTYVEYFLCFRPLMWNIVYESAANLYCADKMITKYMNTIHEPKTGGFEAN